MFSVMQVKRHTVPLLICAVKKQKENLFTSKTGVAPLKKFTLPWLELLGALIGVRLGHYLMTHLQMETTPHVDRFSDHYTG